MTEGWQCPKCSRCYAPTTAECAKCNDAVTVKRALYPYWPFSFQKARCMHGLELDECQACAPESLLGDYEAQTTDTGARHPDPLPGTTATLRNHMDSKYSNGEEVYTGQPPWKVPDNTA